MAEDITEGDKKLLEAFHALNVQPKIENLEDLLSFIKHMGRKLEHEEAIKQQPTPAGATSSSSSHHYAKISTFYGGFEMSSHFFLCIDFFLFFMSFS